MLHLMRKHAGTWMIKLILGAIVIVFVFWGIGSYTSQQRSRVARVNGDTISLEEYRASFNRLVDQMRRSFGNNLDDDLIKALGLERQALDQLIDRRLMLQAAAELGIRVSDIELAENIRSISAFQAAGSFDPERYRRLLDLNRMTPADFETQQREDLTIFKLNRMIVESVKVSDEELEALFKKENAAVEAAYLFFDPAAYPEVTPEPEALQKYFEENKEKYKTAPQRRASFVRFPTARYAEQVSVAEEEVSEYYQANLKEFEEPKTVEARHILLKVDPQADDEKVQAQRRRAEEILAMARGGQDFAELAKQYSEGPSRDQGGYLGTFRREAMVAPFAEAAFSMKAGEISEPVRTQFGWHLIKVEKVNEARTKPLAEVRDEIRRRLAEERARNLAYEDAEAVFEAVFDGESLAEAAATRKLAAENTEFFDRGGQGAKLPGGVQFARAAFELPVGDISEILEFGDGYYLLQPVEEKPAQVPPFEEVAAAVKADLVAALKRQAAEKDAREALAALKGGADMEAVAKQYKLAVKTTGYFKRTEAIAGIGRDAEITQAAFSLSEASPYPEDAIATEKGFYVLAFRGRKAADPEQLEAQREGLRQRLLQQKQQRALAAWLEERKRISEIIVEPGFVGG